MIFSGLIQLMERVNVVSSYRQIHFLVDMKENIKIVNDSMDYLHSGGLMLIDEICFFIEITRK